MNNNERKFLPNGSIVKLRFDDKLYMIVGHLVLMEFDGVKKISDYCIVEYPFGILRKKDFEYIEEDIIKKVIFKGYEDDEFLKYNHELNELLSNIKED